jgi:hypothetical protein
MWLEIDLGALLAMITLAADDSQVRTALETCAVTRGLLRELRLFPDFDP